MTSKPCKKYWNNFPALNPSSFIGASFIWQR
jgi:hypothetical protein